MFRRYEGRWNRFAQPDPADFSYSQSDPQSFNRYSYVQNDPVNNIDPDGLCGYSVHWTQWDDGSITYYTTWDGLCNVGTGGSSNGGGGSGGGTGERGGRGPLQTEAPNQNEGTRGGPGTNTNPTQQPQQTPEPNPQQQGFDDCARAAVSKLRRAEYKAIGKIAAGTVGATLGV